MSSTAAVLASRRLITLLMAEHVALEKTLGKTLTGVWVPNGTRGRIVDIVRRWLEKTEIGAARFIGWLNFEQPLTAHQHWHIDVSSINISGALYYLLQRSGRL